MEVTISELIELLELCQYEARSRNEGDVETNVVSTYWTDYGLAVEVRS